MNVTRGPHSPDSWESSLLMTLQWITACFVKKIRRTAGLLGPIHQNKYSNTIFILVQLALRCYLFTFPSRLPYSYVIRHSTSTAHIHHSTTPHVQYVQSLTNGPHVCHHSTDITHVIIPPLNTHYINIPPATYECHHSTNTLQVSHNSTSTPHACHHSTSTPLTRMSSFCQYFILIVIILTTCHHSTNTPHFIFHKYPHVFVITIISRCCYSNALWGHNSNSSHLFSSSAAKKETDITMPINKWQLLETLFKPIVR